MTIVVDTSAVVAVVLGEPDAEALLAAMLANAGDLQLSAVSLVEAGMVVEARQGPLASDDLRILRERLGIETASVDERQAQVAVGAWRRFGKGRHPAGLTLGDCFSYALAKVLTAPLLYKGNDFGQTDVASAL